MPFVKNVEKKIFEIEHFQVVIRRDGKDVRGDASLPKQYEAEKMTWNSFSVADFREKFRAQYPGYDVDVLMGDGSKAAGQTKLSTVRESYSANI